MLKRITTGIVSALLAIFTAMLLLGRVRQETAPLFVAKLLALLVSFGGLSSLIRNLFKVNRCISPVLAASSVIILMMAAGMLHFLFPMLIALYAIGFAWWIYIALSGRYEADLSMLGIGAAVCAYLFWKNYSATFYYSDDFGHWALVAKFLRLNDRFPTAADNCVRFQTYPLGSASWLYYITRLFDYREGVLIAAQNLLETVMLLPIFMYIKGKKKIAVPCTIIFALFVYKFNRNTTYLLVDWLLGYYLAAILLVSGYERNNPRRMIIEITIMALSSTFIKNSGLYLTAVGAVAAAIYTRRLGYSKKKSFAIALGMIAVCVAGFLLWNMYTHAAFPATATTSMHAVSTTRIQNRYEKAIKQTSLGYIFKVAFTVLGNMLLRWVTPHWIIFITYAIIGFRVAGMICAKRQNDRQHFLHMKNHLIVLLCMMVSWNVMLYLTYIFSMDHETALRLNSYRRYINTVLLPIVICFYADTMADLTDGETKTSVSGRVALAVASAIFIVITPLYYGNWDYFRSYGRAENTYTPFQTNASAWLKEDGHLDKENHYLICASETSSESIYRIFRFFLYELQSNNEKTLYLDEETGMYKFYEKHQNREIKGNVLEEIKAMADECDWVLVDPEFEMAEEVCAGVDNAVMLK